MPTGIILQSGSVGATKEAIEKVLTDNGYEAENAEHAENAEKPEGSADEKEEKESGEELDAGENEAEEVTERPHQPEHKPTRIQKRIAKATAKLEGELRQAKERIAALEGKKPAEPAPIATAPKREDFKTDEEFEDAKFDFRYKQRRAKEESETAQARLQSRVEKNYKDYQASVAAFQEEHDDWEETLANEPKITIPEAAYFAIVDLGKQGPAVTYYLGQNPEKRLELWELTPNEMAFEVKRLADELNGKKAPTPVGEKPKPKPKLPEPVKPLAGSATAATSTVAEIVKQRSPGWYKEAKKAYAAGRMR